MLHNKHHQHIYSWYSAETVNQSVRVIQTQWRGHGWVWTHPLSSRVIPEIYANPMRIFLQGGGYPPIPLILLPHYYYTLIIDPSQQYRIQLWAKLLQLTDRRIWMILWIPVTEFKFKLQHISYSRPNNFRGFNANSETSCVFVAIAKPLICAFVWCCRHCRVL